MAKYIYLTNSSESALVDDDDYEKYSSMSWMIDPKGYVLHTGVGHKRLHRLIMGAQKGQIIDHKDGNPLNCTKANLRFCTNTQNGRNRDYNSNNKLGMKGVILELYRGQPRYRARIQVNGKKISLGYFKNPEDAAKAYREHELKISKEFSYQLRNANDGANV